MKLQFPTNDVLDFFTDNDLFYLIGHRDPDGDCLSSQIALNLFLERMGKKTRLFTPGPYNRLESEPFLNYKNLFVKDINNTIKSDIKKNKNPVAVVVDCSARNRIGIIGDSILNIKTLIIDHHYSGQNFGDLFYIDPTAPSVTILISILIKSLGYSVKNDEAKLLFFGFCTDTGFFRHLENNNSFIFNEISILLKTEPVTPREVFSLIYRNRTLASRKLLGKILARTKSYFSGSILLTYETYEEISSVSEDERDSDALYLQLFSVPACKVIVFLKEEEKNIYTIGLRSNGSVNVAELAALFGGGGHKMASGCTIEGDLTEVEGKIMGRLKDLIN